MGLVRVQESTVLTRDKRLERQFTARSADGLTYEHFAIDYDIRSHREFIVDNLVQFSNVNSSIILSCLDCFNLFHNMYFLLFDFGCKNTTLSQNQQEGT